MTTRIPGGGRRYSRNDDGTSTSNNGKRAPNPPSRHLWVGNLADGVSEEELSFEFSTFGLLESVAFQPGRSYAFVNFKEHDDAVAAINYLQNRSLAGNPLRIEFAKLEKSSAAVNDRDYMKYHDNLRSSSRVSPFSQRIRESSAEQFYPERSNSSDRGGEPSEVLWVGFPALLKVDELILGKAFSPFGEIEKITAFPGRSYAFVRFRSINSAYKAKETLQGKLFGNPRVHICFAKSESGASTCHFKSKTRSDHFPHEPYPPLKSQMYQDSDFDESSAYGNNFVPDDLDWRSREHCRDHTNEHSSRLRRGKDTVYEEPWDFPDESYYHHESKRQRSTSEYLLSDPNKEKYQYRREIPENNDVMIQRALPYRGDTKASDDFRSEERKRPSPEPDHSSLKLWKWKGTIAKGGTPVCRAHCFPVGKPMNFMLPEMVDCTARTGLDMLAKHYYQATCAWVVFFVPDDADIEYYNEFMHYLEEKQRAAVAKLDDKTTLFLVPPSEFSEKVLKVPGNLSISGVALRVENSLERRDPDLTHMHGDVPFSSYESRAAVPNTMSAPPFSGVTSSLGRVTADTYFDALQRQDSGHGIDPNILEPKAPWGSTASAARDAYVQNHTYNASDSDTQKGVSATGGDTQKCLQATLQLAAALLQQIQQGKGT